MAPRIGFIGIIQNELADDPEETLVWVAELGIDGMEGAASLAGELGISVSETRQKLDRLGLKVPVQGRVGADQSDDEIRTVLSTARDIGAPYVVDYYAPFKDRDGILRYAEFAGRVGRMCEEEGLGFLYHNHNHEMRFHDGELGIDIFLANTDGSLVNVELDIGWVAFGGADPVSLIRNHPGRFPVLHMKDFDHFPDRSADSDEARKEAIFAEVGTGAVNTNAVVEAAIEAGTDWLVIEQDRMNKLEPKASLETSYRNLRRMIG